MSVDGARVINQTTDSSSSSTVPPKKAARSVKKKSTTSTATPALAALPFSISHTPASTESLAADLSALNLAERSAFPLVHDSADRGADAAPEDDTIIDEEKIKAEMEEILKEELHKESDASKPNA